MHKKITITLVYMVDDNRDTKKFVRSVYWALEDGFYIPDLITTNAILVEDDDDTEV